mmetsp:Transcript_42750/g.133984  ORF Transcript_42750/g.133984 Transcript_42750/m.133984 type:complete len:385 (-) Transcript_42750:16-1170(-)
MSRMRRRRALLLLGLCLGAGWADPTISSSVSDEEQGAPAPGDGAALPEAALGISISRHGLANRLRVLASASQLARFAGVPLIVDWVPSVACNAAYEDLFEVEPVAPGLYRAGPRDDARFYLLDHRDAQSRVRLASQRVNPDAPTAVADASDGALVEAFWLQSKWVSDEILAALQRRSGLVVVGTGSLAFRIRKVSCIDFYLDKSRFYAGLELRADLAERYRLGIAAWHERVNAATGAEGDAAPPERPAFTFGVHVRQFDDRYDWNVIPTADGSGSVGFGDVAPVAAFGALLASVLRVNPSSRFFVASNSAEVKRALKAAFPGVAMLASEDVFPAPAGSAACGADDLQGRSAAACIQEALLDWSLLARECDIVLHTFGSNPNPQP